MWPFRKKVETKGLSFNNADTFVGDGSNTAFGEYLSATDELWGKPNSLQLERIANTHAVVARCISVTSYSLLEAPLRKGKPSEEEQGWEDAPDGDPDLEKMRQPNPIMRFDEFLHRLVLNRQATGLSFVWIWRDAAGRPAELWPVPTSWVTAETLEEIEPGSTKRTVKQWSVQVPGAKEPARVEPGDMLVWRVPDGRDFLSGASPLASVWRNVMMDVMVGDYSSEMYKNNRSPGMIFKQKLPFTDPQKQAIRGLFDGLFSLGRRGRPLFLGGEDADIKPFPALGDLGFPNVSSLNETRLCMALSVPPILVGCWAGLMNSPWSNIGEARKIFSYFTLVPMWNQLGELLSALLDPEGGWQFYFDTSTVQALQDDATSTAQRATQLVGGGVITRNEARTMVGQQRDEQRGDVYLMPMALQEVPAEEAPAEAEAPPAGPPPPEMVEPELAKPAEKPKVEEQG